MSRPPEPPAPARTAADPGRRRLLAGLAAAALLRPGRAEARIRIESSAGPLLLERLGPRLEQPVALAFLGRGILLVGERAGRVRLVWPTGEVRTLGGLPRVADRGEAGLFDLALLPSIGRSQDLLFSYARPYAFTESRMSVGRAGLDPFSERLSEMTIAFHQPDASEARSRFGGRMVPTSQRSFLLALGERGDREAPDDPGRITGKVLHWRPEGVPAAGSPFLGPNAQPGIWSLGHRDPAGMAIRPADGRLWLLERAEPGTGLYRVLPGLLHGPARETSPPRAPDPQSLPAKAAPRVGPVLAFRAEQRPATLAFVPASSRLAAWAGDLLVGFGRGSELRRYRPEGDRIAGEERLALELPGPVADLRAGPDGRIWMLAGDREGAIWRLGPA